MRIALLVLGGIIPDSYPLRLTLSVSLVLTLATLLSCVTFDVLRATSSAGSAPEADEHKSGC